jgi:anti-sigma factor RsiW
MTCDELDGVVTRFIDGEWRAADRTAIIAHLRVCQGCRTRVDAESTAKHVLQAHATVARTMGVPPPWRPRVFRLGQPVLPVHPTVLLLFTVLVAGLFGVWLRPTPVFAVGVIGDSFCEHEHYLMTARPRARMHARVRQARRRVRARHRPARLRFRISNCPNLPPSPAGASR